MNKLQLLSSLLADASRIAHRDSTTLPHFTNRAQMIIRKVFGDSSSYLKDFDQISFFPDTVYPGMPDQLWDEAWISAKNELIALCKTMIEDVQLLEPKEPASAAPEHTGPPSNRIFVVHGHDEEMKLAVARFLEKLDLTPIILHEQPDKGRTVIEKFLDYSDVAFAIVLLSPDDMGYSTRRLHRNTPRQQPRFRASPTR